jgi:mono/diheme cytochrome c family protein
LTAPAHSAVISCRPAVMAAAVLIVSGFAGACGSSATTSPDQVSSAGSTGAEVYAASCASCHGADLRGTDKGPSHLSIV